MKRGFIVLLVFCLGCGKTTSSNMNPNAGPVVTGNTAPLADSVINYNSLRIFVTQGSSWNCYRFDTIGGSPLLGYQFHSYSGNWQKKLIPDTAVQGSATFGLYYDSSYESFSVNGITTIGQLKQRYLQTGGSTSAYFNPVFNYLVNNSGQTLAYDTSTCAVVTVGNKTRNTTDTEYVFLSKSYFAIIAPVVYISSYNLPGLTNSGYYSVDQSLPNAGILLSAFAPNGHQFIYNNTTYQSDVNFINTSFFRSPNGIMGSSDSVFIAGASGKGLLKSYRFAKSYSPISGFWEKTNRINVQN